MLLAQDIPANDDNELITTGGSVALLRDVSADTIRRWERTGILPAIRTTGGLRLFRRRDVLTAAAIMRGRRRSRSSEVA